MPMSGRFISSAAKVICSSVFTSSGVFQRTFATAFTTYSFLMLSTKSMMATSHSCGLTAYDS